ALTEHLDRLAALVGAADEPVPADVRIAELAAENRALRVAHDRLRERMAVERRRLIESLADALEARDEAAARVVPAPVNHELAAQLAVTRQELAALRGTKLVRWTAPVRRVYGRLRHA
ncbi:MAG TPA: hypothetical protein VHV49_03820, partial [Pseudonocardiaceae bacterium]|nr:hypothetical protein [Pseudonocardiaceae bacterium]